MSKAPLSTEQETPAQLLSIIDEAAEHDWFCKCKSCEKYWDLVSPARDVTSVAGEEFDEPDEMDAWAREIADE